MDKLIYDGIHRINRIVLPDDGTAAAVLTTLDLTEVPSAVLAHGVLDVGHIYNPDTFDAADPATYDPTNPHYPVQLRLSRVNDARMTPRCVALPSTASPCNALHGTALQ